MSARPVNLPSPAVYGDWIGGALGVELPAVLALLALWAVGLALRDLRGPALARPAVKRTHLLPVALQVVLFAYWSVYFPVLRVHVWLILLQLAFAYLFEVLLAWSLRRRYEPGLGPVPVVLSVNLFIWFPREDVYLFFVVIALALASKWLLVRGGRPIFNPSALGITLVGALVIFMPSTFGFTNIAHELGLPPNMAEVVFLLALIPMIKLGTTPVTFGAWMALAILAPFAHMLDLRTPSTMWPSWLITVTLFAGDPATVPRSTLGRLYFGLVVGVGIQVTAQGLLATTGTDYFAKVVPIVIANALVPMLDRAGARAEEALGDRYHRTSWPALLVRPGYVYPLAWCAALFVQLPMNKRGAFEGWIHEQYATPLIVRDAEGHVGCRDNPLYCEVFSFPREVALWASDEPDAHASSRP